MSARRHHSSIHNATTALAQTLSQPSAVFEPVPPPKLMPLMLTSVSAARASSALAAAAAADSTVIPQPLPSTAFPTSTWHSALPATGMPDLTPWAAQGLGSVQAARLDRLVSVYSLGFHQLIRAVRAGMVDPSSTVANLWKMFCFLLNDCMPDGSIYGMRIAQLERDQNARARELLASREAELSKLLKLETELQIRVQELDLALRRVQSHRQNAEDSRLEALDSITAQQSLDQASLEEIAALQLQAEAWQRRLRLAQNRTSMLAEDIRQNARQQHRLQHEQRTLTEDCLSSESDDSNLKSSFEFLSAALTESHAKMMALAARKTDVIRSCAQADSQAADLAKQLIELSGQVALLTQRALRKMHERMRVVDAVAKIQTELQSVVQVELSSSAAVVSLSADRSAVVASIHDLTRTQSQLETDVASLTSQLAVLETNMSQATTQIAEEEARLETLKAQHAHRTTVKLAIETELATLQSQLDTEQDNVAEAERKLAAAMAAVTALTDSLRQAKSDNKSMLREVRVLASHQTQLEEDIATATSNIESHEAHVAQRVVQLKADIVQHQEAIVRSAEEARTIQEDTVASKQRQMDLTATTLGAEQELESLALLVSQQASHLTVVEDSAAEHRAERDRLAAELALAEEERKAGRSTLDAMHSTHDSHLASIQSEIDALHGRNHKTQQHTTLLGQHMAALSLERQTQVSTHDRAVQSVLDQGHELDEQHAAKTSEHRQLSDQARADQMDLMVRLSAIQEQLRSERERTVDLKKMHEAALAKQRVEQGHQIELTAQLERLRRANQAQSGVVSTLSAQVSLAAQQHADHIHDNRSLHHLLEYTRLANKDLAARKMELETAAARRSSMRSSDAQTVGEFP